MIERADADMIERIEKLEEITPAVDSMLEHLPDLLAALQHRIVLLEEKTSQLLQSYDMANRDLDNLKALIIH